MVLEQGELLAERQVLECQIRVRLERGTPGAEESEHEGVCRPDSFRVFPSSSPAILLWQRTVVPSRRALLGSRQTRRRRAWRQNTSYRPLFLVLISGQIKTGSLWRSERNGRYNRLIEIAIRAGTRSLASRR